MTTKKLSLKKTSVKTVKVNTDVKAGATATCENSKYCQVKNHNQNLR